MKIYRNSEGQCINIGDWNYQIEIVDGLKVIQNNLPDGAYEDDADVVTGWDGGLYLSSDPRKNV